MKRFLTDACFSSFWLVAVSGWSQDACPVTALAEIRIAGASFSLADLLSPGSCPEVVRSAAQIHLGTAPLEGSVRIFDGGQIRAWLEQLLKAQETERRSTLVVPARVSVRRARPRSSCREIEDRVFSEASAPAGESDCGAAGRVAEDAPLAVAHRHWDPALHSWMFSARCTHPEDCVPFLIRVPASSAEAATAAGSSAESSPAHNLSHTATEAELNPLVRPGDKASVLWDQDGIRLTIPAICMDKGRAGDTVRARLERSNRVVHAVVVSSGQLRVQS